MSNHSTDRVAGPGNEPAGSRGARFDPFWDSSELGVFYDNFFSVINVMAILVDRNDSIRLFNDRAEEITGYKKEETIGSDFFSLLVPRGIRERTRALLTMGESQGLERWQITIPLVTRDRQTMAVTWGVSLVRKDDGEPFGLLIMGNIESDQRREAEPKVAGPRPFTDKLSHDILNHNQVALGYLELAIDRSANFSEARCMLDRAIKALRRSSDLALSVYRINRDDADAAALGGETGRNRWLKPE